MDLNTPEADLVSPMPELLDLRGQVGEPADAAAMVTFLASPASSWITGQTYPVNGGFSVSQ
jgi:3-oxoacyl-[acyl-carrier protein] reductase